MLYGLPYKGSKNAIAKWVIDNLPYADTFVDLFFGGGAITHCAMLTCKYKHFIINDIDARLPKLFVECVNGKHTLENHKEWISREEFNARKEQDAFIGLVWSFGNNGKDYIYGTDIEDYKKAFHYAVVYNDFSMINEYGIPLVKSNIDDLYKRYLEYSRQIKNENGDRSENYTRVQVFENVRRLVELERLQRLGALERLQRLGVDYQSVPIPSGSLVYCDIPYIGSNCGKYDGFDHERFYRWAEEQDNIYISEYQMPEQFIPIAWVEKTVLSTSNGNSLKAKEILFTNKRTYNRLSETQKEMAKMNFAEQMSLFDFLQEG